MKYVAKIEVKVEEANEMQEILNIEEGTCEEYDRDGVIKTYSCSFSNGFFADIKVCNGDTPYVDSVLFDEQGCEVAVLDVDETLLGDYSFEFEGDTYEVEVVESDEDARQTIYPAIRKGISIFSSAPVEIIGERTVEHEGKILEQFLYNIVGHQPENGKPFVSLKANIIVD